MESLYFNFYSYFYTDCSYAAFHSGTLGVGTLMSPVSKKVFFKSLLTVVLLVAQRKIL